MESIKACIMAGGKGSRLKPLTGDLPKPLAPLLGKPIIRYILELLRKHGVESAVAALGHQASKLIAALDGCDILPISYSIEDEPLGTAGAVKRAMEGSDHDFIVISGDAMCDLDISAAYRFHRAQKADVTILSTRVADPREYGLIQCGDDGRVEGFLEKPSYHNCSCDLASTGIYIISPAVLELIPSERAMDFASELFPSMLKHGRPIYAFEASGYWCDVGDTASYARCQADMLHGRVRFEHDCTLINGVYCKDGALPEDCAIGAPAYIGAGVSLSKGAIISDGSVICDNVTVAAGTTITRSILLDGCYIGADCAVNAAVCCSGVRLCDGVTVMDGAVIGSNATLERNAVIQDGVRVWSGKVIPEGMTVSDDVQFGVARPIIVDEDGISGQTNIRITPELCVKIGSSIASLSPYGLVGIGYNHEGCSKALHHAIAAGVMAAGGTAWDFGEASRSQFEFCIAKSNADFGVYIDGGSQTTIAMCERGGLPTCRSAERRLEGAINRGEYKRVTPQHMGNMVDMSGLKRLYEIEIVKQCDLPLSAQIHVKAQDKAIRHLLEDTLVRLGCTVGDGLTISLSQGGVIIYDDDSTATAPMILSLLCLYEFERGEDVYIPETAPRIIDSLAQKHGRRAFRYAQCPCDSRDSVIRQKAITRPFLRDPLMMAVRLIAYMAFKRMNLTELLTLIPSFEQSSRLVPVDTPPTVILGRLKCDKQPLSEGMLLTKNGMSAMVRPMKSGRGIMVFTETIRSLQSETAVEICDIFESLIRGDGE